MDQRPIAEFRSIETLDPTRLALYPDRVELDGGGRRAPRTVTFDDITRVRIRTLFGVSTVLIRSASGPALVADLFAPVQAQAARELLEELRAAPPAQVDAAAPAA